MSASAKDARSAVEQRNVIVPQMVDYDELGTRQEWVPYLMYFNPRNVVLKSVSTDDRGFRKTTGGQSTKSTALLIGGSTVFGIGATSDGSTITSRLNELTEHSWLNFGGRAFNSTQEAMLVHLSNTTKVDGPIVVMSGINNLTRLLLPGSFSPMYGAFFQQSFFEKQMATAAVGNRELLRMLVNGLLNKFGIGKGVASLSPSETTTKSESYSAMLKVFERDCEYLQMFAAHHGTTASFALQPFAPWMSKTLSTQETQLFALLDQEGEGFSLVLKELTDYKKKYSQDLRTICSRVGMKYLDLNEAPELQQPEWLFVDRAHLTDAGYDAVAGHLVRELAL
ncbi:MAG: hypothetical protein NT119_04345 [Actinobacteria bacterium]|nr:hypothetical protein [Actinomycetota bacterium]